VVAKSTYKQVTGISNAVAIASGGQYVLALRSDGKIFATGLNAYGQLGDSTVVAKSTYIQVTSI